MCIRDSNQLSDKINLTTHVEDVEAAVQAAGFSEFVLCGHSYGGMVITGVGDRLADSIAGIFYLDALLPEDGQSVADISGFEPPEGFALTPFPVEIFGIADPKMARWVSEMMTPHPMGTLTQKLRVTRAYAGIPRKIHLVSTGFRLRPGGLENFRATPGNPIQLINERLSREPGWTTVSTYTGHHVMLDDPELVVSLLNLAASPPPPYQLS